MTEDVCPGVENIDLSPMIASVRVMCVCVCEGGRERGRESVGGSGWICDDSTLIILILTYSPRIVFNMMNFL